MKTCPVLLELQGLLGLQGSSMDSELRSRYIVDLTVSGIQNAGFSILGFKYKLLATSGTLPQLN